MAVPRPLQSPIAGPGLPVSGVLAGLAALAAVLGGWSAAGTALALAGLNLAFFRNPRRLPPEGESVVVAPGDGRVVEVVKLEEPDGFVGPAWRVAIFLSIFDVHVNRVPLSGKVRAVHSGGRRFRAAFGRRASQLNVQTRLDVEAPDGARLAVVQITGLIARRILCYPREGDTLVRGEPYGLICYGSRVELYLPASTEVSVRAGDRVRGGVSAIGEVRP